MPDTGSLGNKYKFVSIDTRSRSLTPELMEIEQKNIKIIGLGNAPDFGLTYVRRFGFTPGGPVIRFEQEHTHTSP